MIAGFRHYISTFVTKCPKPTLLSFRSSMSKNFCKGRQPFFLGTHQPGQGLMDNIVRISVQLQLTPYQHNL